MKILIQVFILISFCNSVFAQSLYKSAESKSGLIAGTEAATPFAGLSYSSSTNEYSFNYKSIKHLKFKPKGFPNFKSHNFDLTIALEKGKTKIIDEGIWNGEFGFSYGYTYTTDNTLTGSDNTKDITEIYYVAPGKQYKTLFECLKNHTICEENPIVKNEFVPKINQRTFFYSIGSKVERLNTGLINNISTDSSTIEFDKPLKFTLEGNLGFNWLQSAPLFFDDDWFFSWAFSTNLKYISNSNRSLTKEYISKFNNTYYSTDQQNSYQSLGKEQFYYIGLVEEEFIVIPRVDIFLRHRLGKDRPYIGLVSAYSYIASNLLDNNRNNIILGVSLSPPILPDQIIFGIFNEWNENKDGDMDYSLSFRASFPITFN